MEARQELALTPQQSFCQFFQDTLVKTIKLLESLVRYMCVSHPRDLYLKNGPGYRIFSKSPFQSKWWSFLYCSNDD